MNNLTFRLASPDQRDAFGIVVSYAVKVKLYLGALGGELAAELPFILMHPRVSFNPPVIYIYGDGLCFCFLAPKGKDVAC